MNTSGLYQSLREAPTLQETRSISMNIQKIKFIS